MIQNQEQIKTLFGRCILRKRNFFMALVLVLLLAGVALAVNVNLSGDLTGTYELNSMSISSDGTISLSVSSGGTQTPSLTLSTSPSTLPAGKVDVAYSQKVTMTASNGTTPYTYSCSTSSAGISASASSNTCSISGTPTSSGTYSVNFRVNDNASDTAQRTSYFSVAGGVSTGEPSGVKTITDGEILDRVSIRSGATLYYKFIIPKGSQGLQLSLSTWDWITNQDMMLSQGLPYPTSDDYTGGKSVKYNGDIVNDSAKWARISPGSSNETLYIYPNLPAGTYYVMVHNTSGMTGSFGLHVSYW
jgi:hypothetical protein